MEIDSIHHLPQISNNSLNIEEKVLLKSALTILKQDYKLQQLNIWGKIFGIQRDYIIASGSSSVDLSFKNTVYFYSMDAGLTWGQLQQPSDESFKIAAMLYRRFLGDPSYVYAGAKLPDAPETPYTEEMRLAAIVYAITMEAAVVPSGSVYRDHQGVLTKNNLFHGLSNSSTVQLKDFVHLHNNSGSGIDKDTPQGSWCLKIDQTGKFAFVNSLLWPGFTAYHIPSTPQYGHVYMGTGIKNKDIGFMI